MNCSRVTRNSNGFTLAFALMLTVIFSSLLLGIFLFINSNTKQSYKTILKLQAINLAEAGNARALARLNIKTLPTLPEDYEEEDLEDEDDEFFDEFDDDDFFEDEDEDDEDFFGDEFDLANIPRYINFFQIEPYYINVNGGDVINQGTYFSLIAQQRDAIALAKKENSEDPNLFNPLLIQDQYLPLPEVNVERIGTIPIPRGTHFEPGLKIVLANQVAVELKQPSIREEYLNVPSEELSGRVRTKIYNITPNFAEIGQLVDISASGENLDLVTPNFSSGSINIVDSSGVYLSVETEVDAKPGRYRLKWGSDYDYFYLVPALIEGIPPEIEYIYLANESEGQFTTIKNNEELVGLKIKGENLGSPDNPPIIVPDAKGVEVEVTSFTDKEIIFNIKTRKAIPGSYLLSVFNEFGQSNGWIFSIEESPDSDSADPNIGTYSTVITLLDVTSLSNIPFGEFVEGDDLTGRPDEAEDESGGTNGGRAQDARANDPQRGDTRRNSNNKSFDLLKSDLESIWKIETVATVNKVNYKATSIVRRTLPKVSAALTTNSKLSFGISDLKIQGVEEATTTLDESATSGDTTIIVPGTDPEEQRGISQIENPNDRSLSCEGIIENLINCGSREITPASFGFEPGRFIAVIDPGSREEFTDFSIIESIGSNTITVKEPFDEVHYLNDKVVQFVPSVITNFGISRLDAQKYLEPLGSHIKIPGEEKFDNTFEARLEDIKNWTGKFTTDTDVPIDEFEDYEGYFGLNIVNGIPNYDGLNALAGEGLLIVDTTNGGTNPPGTVTIGGNNKLPSIFDGVVYIIGNLKVNGAAEINGAVIVNSPNRRSNLEISGRGFIRYNRLSLQKSIIEMPFTKQINSYKVESSRSQAAFIESHSDALEPGEIDEDKIKFKR